MFKNLLRAILLPVYRLFLLSPLRYSGYFLALQNLFIYSPREVMLKTAMEYVAFSQLEGDYLEFGVYEGGTFVTAFHFAQRNKLDAMKFYAFDSFAGLPEIRGMDAEGVRQFQQGEYACDVDRFKRVVSRKGVDLGKVEVVPGWYDEVLNEETKRELPLKAASIVCIDCNLYESTVPVLNFVTDYLQDGTILIFDDWFCFRGHPDRGQRKAFTEWLDKTPSITATEFHRFGWNGNSFIIHRH